MTCRGLGCKCTELINAHIMPRGFARDIMGDRTHNIQVSMSNAKPTQHGVYDPNILCASCDGTLGEYDDYAIEVCRRFGADHVAQNEMFTMSNVNGDTLAKFVLAVLWRASISARPEFKKVALGPYEAPAQEVLFGARALKDMPGFELMLFRYKENKKFKVEGVYTSPSTVHGLGVNGWGFAVSGFRFVAKMDKRPWPGLPAEFVKEMVVNGSNNLVGMFVDFAGSLEHRATLEMAAAHLARKQKASK